MSSEAKVAGYEIGGNWYDVEGDSPGSVPYADELTPDMLPEVDMLTVHVKDASGGDFYYTLHGPWEDWDSLMVMVDDLYTEYGGEAA